MKYCMHYAYFRTNIRRKQVAKHTHKYPQLILKNIVYKNIIITNTYLYTFWYLHTEFYICLNLPTWYEKFSQSNHKSPYCTTNNTEILI